MLRGVAQGAGGISKVVYISIAVLTATCAVISTAYFAAGRCPQSQRGGAGRAGDDALFAAIDSKFEFLNAFTALRHPTYAKGLWGIANKIKGDQHCYGTSKTRFIFDELRSRIASGAGLKIKTICELGFNAGHSALLFLDIVPEATLMEFDLGDTPWAAHNQALLKEAYGDRFQYILGDSTNTIPAYAAEIAAGTRPRCDVLFVDGQKDEGPRRRDVENMVKISHADTLVFGDEGNTVECVGGQVEPTHALCSNGVNGLFDDTSRAWNKLVREGFLKFSRAPARSTLPTSCAFGCTPQRRLASNTAPHGKRSRGPCVRGGHGTRLCQPRGASGPWVGRHRAACLE